MSPRNNGSDPRSGFCGLELEVLFGPPAPPRHPRSMIVESFITVSGILYTKHSRGSLSIVHVYHRNEKIIAAQKDAERWVGLSMGIMAVQGRTTKKERAIHYRDRRRNDVYAEINKPSGDQTPLIFS